MFNIDENVTACVSGESFDGTIIANDVIFIRDGKSYPYLVKIKLNEGGFSLLRASGNDLTSRPASE